MISSSFHEIRLIAQLRNISGYENKSKEELIKALSEPKPEAKPEAPKPETPKPKPKTLKPKPEPAPEPKIKVNTDKRKLKKFRKKFDELRHKFSKLIT